MKKSIFVAIISLFLFFAFLPSSASASSAKRLDEVLGSYAMTLVGKVEEETDHYGEVAKEMGKKILQHFKGRENELNKIVGGALGTDGQLPLWDDIVDFAFPVEQKSVEITATPELKSGISRAVIIMPKEIPLNDGWTRIEGSVVDNDNKKLGDSKYLPVSITVPKGWTFILASDYSLTRQSVSGYESDYRYAPSAEITARQDTSSTRYSKKEFSYVNGQILTGTLTLQFRPQTSLYTINELSFSIATPHTSSGQMNNWRYMIYQDVPPTGGNIDVTNYLNQNYMNNSSNDNYHIINGQVGDNTTVNHEFDKKYQTFDDYGLRPDESAPTTGQSILSKLLDFMNGLGDLINQLVTALLAMVEKVVELFIPTAEQLAMMGDSVSQISEGLQSKFQGFTAIGESFTGVYSSPQSMLNMTIPTQQGDVELIPSYLHGVVGTMRSLLSGFSVVMTGIYIYKRIVGSGDVIQS